MRRVGSCLLPISPFLIVAASLLYTVQARGQGQSVTVRAETPGNHSTSAKRRAASNGVSEVVVWLTPLEGTSASKTSSRAHKVQLVQRNKSFAPHLLVIPVGTTVDFPNKDPFFHNVFSLFEGKRFDLGLYEAGATNSVRFDRVGVSFLFCNIHPEMSAVIVAVDTPYFGISDSTGTVLLPDIPEGKYELHAWYERSASEDLKKLTRTVQIAQGRSDLGTLAIVENPAFTLTHKNKYGEDYTPAPTPGYSPK